MGRTCSLVCLAGSLAAGQAVAEEIYQWRDDDGGIHFANVRPGDAPANVVYSEAGGTIYEWRDEAGQVYYGDTPPEGTAKPREIPVEPWATDRLTDPDEYSIVRQAERMAEDRRRIAEDRILRERMRVERSRLERDKAVLRMQEQLRTRGYGPRPEAWPYSYEYDDYD